MIVLIRFSNESSASTNYSTKETLNITHSSLEILQKILLRDNTKRDGQLFEK